MKSDKLQMKMKNFHLPHNSHIHNPRHHLHLQVMRLMTKKSKLKWNLIDKEWVLSKVNPKENREDKNEKMIENLVDIKMIEKWIFLDLFKLIRMIHLHHLHLITKIMENYIKNITKIIKMIRITKILKWNNKNKI